MLVRVLVLLFVLLLVLVARCLLARPPRTPTLGFDPSAFGLQDQRLNHSDRHGLHQLVGDGGGGIVGSARLGSAQLSSARLTSAQLSSAWLGSAWVGLAQLGSAQLS